VNVEGFRARLKRNKEWKEVQNPINRDKNKGQNAEERGPLTPEDERTKPGKKGSAIFLGTKGERESNRAQKRNRKTERIT